MRAAIEPLSSPDLTNIRILCNALEKILNARLESTALRVLQDEAVARPEGLRIVRSETGFRVYPDSRMLQTNRLGRFVKKIEDELCQHWRFADAALLPLQHWLRSRITSARLHTRAGMIISAALFGCLRTGSKGSESKPAKQLRIMLMSSLLSEPERVVKCILRSNAIMNAQFYSRRMAHLENQEESMRLVRDFVWVGESDYRELVKDDKTSRILLTIHMGDFTGAFKRISSHANADRTATTLKREDTDQGWINLFDDGGMRHSLIRHGDSQLMKLVGQLRQGGHTLTILADLKEDFGQTTEVTFFGHTATLVKGPAQLALAGRARIFPFVTYQSGQKQHIEFADPVSPELLKGEAMPDAVNRITQRLALLAEKWIRRSPEQWKFVSTLPGYFVTEETHGQRSVQN